MKPKKTIDAVVRQRKPKIRPLSKGEYFNYIKSPAWQATRKRFWASKFPKACVCCGVSNCVLDLHHKSYKTLGSEKLHHLCLVCRECHGQIHKANKRGLNLWTATKLIQKRYKHVKIDITEPNMASKQGEGREKPMAPTDHVHKPRITKLCAQSGEVVSCHRSGSIANGTPVLDLRGVNYQGMSDCRRSWENDLAP